jgi:hypothetical protein
MSVCLTRSFFSHLLRLTLPPSAYIYHNLISGEEAHHLIQLAAPQMKRSTVVGPDGSSVEDG